MTRFVEEGLRQNKGRWEATALAWDRVHEPEGPIATRLRCGSIPPALSLARRYVHELPP